MRTTTRPERDSRASARADASLIPASWPPWLVGGAVLAAAAGTIGAAALLAGYLARSRAASLPAPAPGATRLDQATTTGRVDVAATPTAVLSLRVNVPATATLRVSAAAVARVAEGAAGSPVSFRLVVDGFDMTADPTPRVVPPGGSASFALDRDVAGVPPGPRLVQFVAHGLNAGARVEAGEAALAVDQLPAGASLPGAPAPPPQMPPPFTPPQAGQPPPPFTQAIPPDAGPKTGVAAPGAPGYVLGHGDEVVLAIDRPQARALAFNADEGPIDEEIKRVFNGAGYAHALAKATPGDTPDKAYKTVTVRGNYPMYRLAVDLGPGLAVVQVRDAAGNPKAAVT